MPHDIPLAQGYALIALRGVFTELVDRMTKRRKDAICIMLLPDADSHSSIEEEALKAAGAQSTATFDAAIDEKGNFYSGWKRAGKTLSILFDPDWLASQLGMTAKELQESGSELDLSTLAIATSEDEDAFDDGGDISPFMAFLDKPPTTAIQPAKAKEKRSGKQGVEQSKQRGAAPGRRTSTPRCPQRDPFDGSPEQMRELDKHVINLRAGKLSDGGADNTSLRDLEQLVEILADKASDGSLKHVLFWAHGGLVDEKSALSYAWDNIEWWAGNGVYPVFFVWETAGLDTIRQLVEAATRRNATRGFTDATDWLVEKVCRAARGIWSAMKSHAQLSSSAMHEGGAYLFARLLAERADAFDNVEFHAVGHSAGSIFHNHFLPTLERENSEVSGEILLQSVQFLAPAVTIADYSRLLEPLIKQQDIRFTTFTMDRRAELADSCFGVYRKSLLYLVSRAFEPQRGTPILGLEESLGENAADSNRIRGDFARTGNGYEQVLGPSAQGAVDWKASTTARKHGDFDNDPATMKSVASRIIGREAADYKVAERRSVFDQRFSGSQDELLELLTRSDRVFTAGPAPTTTPAVTAMIAPGGSRHFLSVAIDDYEGTARLHGCLNDSRLWRNTFAAMGFTTEKLHDREATAAALRNRFRSILEDASHGDQIVIHMSSHGTQVLDVDGDEPTSSPHDEALACHDYLGDDGIITDDELYEIFSLVPRGVSLVTIFDLCHSGNSTRMLLRAESSGIGPSQVKQRFLHLPPKLYERAGHRDRSTAASALTRPLRHLAIAACQPNQAALERDGNGIFSRVAAPILGRSGGNMSGAQFLAEVERAFGQDLSVQRPMIEGPDGWEHRPLFSPAV